MPIKKNDLLKEIGCFLKFDVEVDYGSKKKFYLYFSKMASLYFLANLFSIPRAEIVSIFLKLVFSSYK